MPACFEIEERLRKECTLPVFHDDQHSTAIVTSTGLINGIKLVSKTIDQIRVVIHGADAAGSLHLLLNKEELGEEAFKQFDKWVDIGDFIGAEGSMFTTKTMEITLRI